MARPAETATEATDDVLVIKTLGAQRASKRLRRGKPVPIEAADIEPLPLTRVTVVKAMPFAGDDQAKHWLADVASDRDRQVALASEAMELLNRAIHAHAVATNYPYASDRDPNMATALRFGYGAGEEVAEGQWTEARELAEGERRKILSRNLDSVGAQERVAAVLGRRATVMAADTFLLRARGDVEQGRLAAAALGVETALSAVQETTDPAKLAELRREATDLARLARTNRLGDEEEPRLRKLLGTSTRLVSPRAR